MKNTFYFDDNIMYCKMITICLFLIFIINIFSISLINVSNIE